MKYKYLIILFLFTIIANRGFSQTAIQQADLESKKLTSYFALSSRQEDSLKSALPAYYLAKADFMQLTNRTSADTKNLQKLHDDILKRIFTTSQYQLYEAVKQQQVQIMRNKIDSLSNQ